MRFSVRTGETDGRIGRFVTIGRTRSSPRERRYGHGRAGSDCSPQNDNETSRGPRIGSRLIEGLEIAEHRRDQFGDGGVDVHGALDHGVGRVGIHHVE